MTDDWMHVAGHRSRAASSIVRNSMKYLDNSALAN